MEKKERKGGGGGSAWSSPQAPVNNSWREGILCLAVPLLSLNSPLCWKKCIKLVISSRPIASNTAEQNVCPHMLDLSND